MKLVLWTSIPNHYQASLLSALRGQGTSVVARYSERVPRSRLALGWSDNPELPEGDEYVPAKLRSLTAIPEWRERLHLIPGASRTFLILLIRRLSKEGVDWAHWSERSHRGCRWYLSYAVKRWLAGSINKYAVGAFAQGALAFADFQRWGVDPSKICQLSYASPPADRGAAPDQLCQNFQRQRKSFLYLGSLCRRKGTDVLIEAFGRVAKKSLEWTLILAGNDCGRGQYQKMARRYGVEDRVLFRGSVAPAQLSNVMASAHVLILPSRFDGWGITLNEGASMGLPLIGSTAVESANHLIEPGLNGVRVRPGCTESLARAMSIYVNEPSLLTIHGARSLRIYSAFTPERNAEKLLAALGTWQAMGKGKRC